MSSLPSFRLTADRFDKARDDVAERAKERMNNSALSLARSQVSGSYSGVRAVGGKLQADLRARYLLFPVYLFKLTHRKNEYSFAVNGQTGKIVGSVPTDKKVSWQYFLIRAGIALLIAALVARGETQILNASSIDRGYEDVETRLSELGAAIRREE